MKELRFAILDATLVHAFFDATLGNETILHRHQQFMEHIHGLMDEGDAEVGNLLVIHALYLRGIVFLDILAARILAHLFITRMKITPLLEASNAQVVLVIVKKFFEAGFRHIGQFDFGLTGGGGRLIAFSYVLLATSGCLYHLVDSAVAALEIVLGEVVGDVVNHLSDLIDTEVAVMAVLGEEGVGGS